MSDKTGGMPLFEQMLSAMRFPGFGGLGGAPGMPGMSGVAASLNSVEELDKRITDMRAVEQWLKLNLGLLQSAIQGLEVQRATLETLRAFGAFAQSSFEAASAGAAAAAKASGGAEHARTPPDPSAGAEPDTEPDAEQAPPAGPFDPSVWWNMLQAQFNQIAGMAMAAAAPPPDAASAAGVADAAGAPAPTGKNDADGAAAEASTTERGTGRRKASTRRKTGESAT